MMLQSDTDASIRSRETIIGNLHTEIAFGVPYFALAAASCAIATLGLLENSAPIIIGAMLIAPLMTPIVALALAIISGDLPTLRLSVAALVSGAALAIAFSAGIAAIAHLSIPGSEILGRSQPNLLDLGVALAAGAIAGFARVNTKIASSVGGAAIAVALMPPLCVVGIGLALHAFELSYGALLLFITNLLGITLACAVVFVSFRLAEKGARRGLITTGILVVAVAVPLVFATFRLIEQQRLESILRQSLVNDTQTFKHVELISTDIDWVSNPIRVQLLVRMQGILTPAQVGYLQSFASARIHTNRPLRLIVGITPVTQVVAPAPNPTGSP
jgi:uncharacterized hydrophobic protein (TIGR00271 family)